MNPGIASCSVRPIRNIEGESKGDTHAQFTDEQDKLYDKLMEPFDERDEKEGQSTDEYEDQSSSGEAVEARAAKVSKRPTQIEVDQHMMTNLPFRSWCPHCVRGKSKGRPHPQNKTKGKSLRWCWLTCVWVNRRMRPKKGGCLF